MQAAHAWIDGYDLLLGDEAEQVCPHHRGITPSVTSMFGDGRALGLSRLAWRRPQCSTSIGARRMVDSLRYRSRARFPCQHGHVRSAAGSPKPGSDPGNATKPRLKALRLESAEGAECEFRSVLPTRSVQVSAGADSSPAMSGRPVSCSSTLDSSDSVGASSSAAGIVIDGTPAMRSSSTSSSPSFQ